MVAKHGKSSLIVFPKSYLLQCQGVVGYEASRNHGLASNVLIWTKSRGLAKNFLKRPLQAKLTMLSSKSLGDVAQLEERNNRTVEVRGSSPLISTQTTYPRVLTKLVY